MEQEKNKRIPLDENKINMRDPEEVSWWCCRFSCTEDELLEAIHAVGTSAKAVRDFFGL